MAGETILVVDDSRAMREFMVDYVLKPKGYLAMLAVDGEEGVQLALEQHPDLIILDVELPRMDGMEVLHALKANGLNIPVIMATAHAYQTGRQRVPASLIDTAALIADGPGLVIASSDDGQISLDLTLKRYVTLRDRQDRLALQGPFYEMLSAGVLDHTVERWLLDPTFRAPTVGLLFEAGASQNLAIRLSARRRRGSESG